MGYLALKLSATPTTGPVECHLSANMVLRLLNDNATREVSLFGKPGVGKTWLAREVCRSARLEGFSRYILWFTPEDDLGGKPSVREDYERRLLKNVALQLSLYPSNEEPGVDDPELLHREDLDEHDLKQMIRDKLHEASTATGQPEVTPSVYPLVVLDGFAKEDRNKLLEELSTLLPFPKFLITGLDENQGSMDDYQEIREGVDRSHVFLMKGLSAQSSMQLLMERVEGDVRAASGFNTLRAAFEKPQDDSFLPSVIVMLADALNNVKRHVLDQGDHGQHAGEWTLDSSIQEAASIFRSGDTTRLTTSLVYEMLPPSGTITFCSWHVRNLFAKPHSIHFTELIAHWLLEGYFDDLGGIQNAFKEGHRMLMALKDRGILRELENDFVSLEGAAVIHRDPRKHAFYVPARLGLADVMTEDCGWTGPGKVTLAGGILKTSHKKNDEVRTLIVDGMIHRWRQLSGTYQDTMQNLRVLVILNPTFKDLPLPMLSLRDLQVLVLRGCSALVDIDKLSHMEKLLAVEVSGAASLDSMNDSLFENMVSIRSVNLSGAGITSAPSSLFERPELRRLILRDCKDLEYIHRLTFLEKLEVLDLSGSTNFRGLRDKFLQSLQNLHTLDVSHTSINRLPFFGNLAKLSRLLLSECLIRRLPPIRPLNALEILDLSGNMAVKELQDDFLKENSGLRILNLSRSGITRMPEMGTNLTHLLLKDCTNLTTLSIESLQHLQVLNLSGATSLSWFEDRSLKNLRDLQDIILSGTKIEVVPKLCAGSKIRRLLLKDCRHLNVLPNLEELESLEVLDLSGCSSLDITDASFSHMSNLRVLNLSGMKLRRLAPKCFPTGLSQLIIRDCPNLLALPVMESPGGLEKLDLCGSRLVTNIEIETLECLSNLQVLNLSDVPLKGLPPMSCLTKLKELSLGGYSYGVEKLGDLTKLELLDLSRTIRVSLPPLKCFLNLRQLLLRDCHERQNLEDLKVLKKLEVLDIAGTNTVFPLDFTKLTGLRKLHLQELTQSDWKKIKHVPEDFHVRIKPNFVPNERISLIISGVAFFRFLKAGADLWDSCFRQFHFSVWIPIEKTRRKSMGGTRNTALLEYNAGFLKYPDSIGRVPLGENYRRFLEIHGSFVPEIECYDDEVPEGDLEHSEAVDTYCEVLKDGLMRAEHLSLIDDGYISSISQLGNENLKALESLWLESCNNITSIIERIEDVSLGAKLISLYLYNLSSLNSMYDGRIEDIFSGIEDIFLESFTRLKKLHVESCPLSKIFNISSIPENLQVVGVKFCQDTTMIFDSMDKSAECKLLKLQLVELPNLIQIGVFMPFLKELKLRGCPDVEDLEEVLGDVYNLETLHISDAVNLHSIWTGPQRPGTFQKLNDLKLESCPILKYLFSSPLLPGRLKQIDIKHCGELTFLFNSSSPRGTLSGLQSICLWNLPNLKGIGVEIPRECSFKRWECPNLPNTT